MARRPGKRGRVGRPARKVANTHRKSRDRSRRLHRSAARLAEKNLESGREAHDFEDLLVKSLAFESAGGAYKDISMQDMLLDLTKSGRKLAYNYGFTVGTGVHSEDPRIDALFRTLEKFGLGRVLYQPSQDSLIITARESRFVPLAVGGYVHVYEAGLIAGYLTASVGRRIAVRETHCIYNNSSFCQFIAQPSGREADYGRPLDAGVVIDTIAETIRNLPAQTGVHSAERGYYLLPTLPLLKSPLVDEASKLLYVIGIRIAELGRRDEPAATIGKIASYFDMANAQLLSTRGNRRIIRLKYKHYNSIDQLVKLSTSMVIGYANAAFDSDAELEMHTGKDSNYVVRIRLAGGREQT